MRDNCDNSLYCDPNQLTCQRTAAEGQPCESDHHCNSSNCAFPPTTVSSPDQTNLNSSNLISSYIQDGTCAPSPATPLQLSNWVYFGVVIGIGLAMFGIVFGLFQLHKVESRSRREMLNQYWDEQLAFRKSIINLHSTTISHRPPSHSQKIRREWEESKLQSRYAFYNLSDSIFYSFARTGCFFFFLIFDRSL